MKLYIENPKDATRKLLELINEFGKAAGHKINAQKSVAFLYTNNERSEREIKETIPFTILSNRMKYQGINLTKEVKSCTQKMMTLMKETEDNTNKWTILRCSWIGRINIVKATILPQSIYRFNAMAVKISMTCFTDLEQIILNFVWKHKRP